MHLLSIPAAFIAGVVLVIAGRFVGLAVLIALAVQFSIFATALAAGLRRRHAEKLHAHRDRHLDDELIDTAALWNRYLDGTQNKPPFRIAVMACDEAQNRDLAHAFAGHNHRVFHIRQYEEMIARITDHPERWDLVFFLS